MLNLALFGKTAKQWREDTSTGSASAKKDLPAGKAGNIRDFANLEQLVVLSNMESINAMLIQQDVPQPKRLQQLNQL